MNWRYKYKVGEEVPFPGGVGNGKVVRRHRDWLLRKSYEVTNGPWTMVLPEKDISKKGDFPITITVYDQEQ